VNFARRGRISACTSLHLATAAGQRDFICAMLARVIHGGIPNPCQKDFGYPQVFSLGRCKRPRSWQRQTDKLTIKGVHGPRDWPHPYQAPFGSYPKSLKLGESPCAEHQVNRVRKADGAPPPSGPAGSGLGLPSGMSGGARYSVSRISRPFVG